VAFRVAVRAKADKTLARMGPSMQERILEGLRQLKADPFTPRPKADIRMLRGDRAQLRLRVGDYRVFYVVDEDVVYVTDILHRSHAYD
jgi:mRNA-degrading endonuclease RelE of RelBE toxin-antitoxin system